MPLEECRNVRHEQTAQITDREALKVSEATWSLIDRSAGDENAESEEAQDIQQMQGNPQAHLTAAATRFVVREPASEAAVQIVLPHLCQCAWCRDTLHQTLELCEAQPSHPAYDLLQEAEEWAQWDTAGRRATEAARRGLREQGASSIYKRDGALWEECADGTVIRLDGEAKVPCP